MQMNLETLVCCSLTLLTSDVGTTEGKHKMGLRYYEWKGKGGLAVNRTVLENILKASRHANWMMSILPFLDTFSTNPNRLTGSFIPSTKSVFLLCPFL